MILDIIGLRNFFITKPHLNIKLIQIWFEGRGECR